MEKGGTEVETSEVFGVSRATLHKWKKLKRETGSLEEKRSEFVKKIAEFDKKQLVFVDECGIQKNLYSEYGWARKGEVIYAEISGKRSAKINLVAALCNKKILAPLPFYGNANAKLISNWIKHYWIPELSPDQVVVLDNAPFHKKRMMKE